MHTRMSPSVFGCEIAIFNFVFNGKIILKCLYLNYKQIKTSQQHIIHVVKYLK